MTDRMDRLESSLDELSRDTKSVLQTALPLLASIDATVSGVSKQMQRQENEIQSLRAELRVSQEMNTAQEYRLKTIETSLKDQAETKKTVAKWASGIVAAILVVIITTALGLK